MPDPAAPSADGREKPASLPIDENVCLALDLLRHAYECARDAGAPPWDFALEIHELYQARLTITDLRWLVVKGFVAHGGETSVYGDAHRSFTLSDGVNFLATTCVVLTEKGAAFACRRLHQAAAPKEAEEPPTASDKATPLSENSSGNGNGQAKAAFKPHWDPARRELCLGDLLIKRFVVPAGNQVLILAAFQEEDWPEFIDDPLPGRQNIDPRIRLNDVIYRLNRTQATPLIRFHTNGNGNGVHWSLCDPIHRPGEGVRNGTPLSP